MSGGMRDDEDEDDESDEDEVPPVPWDEMLPKERWPGPQPGHHLTLPA